MSGGLSMRPIKKVDEEGAQSPDIKMMLQGLLNKANPFADETAVASEPASAGLCLQLNHQNQDLLPSHYQLIRQSLSNLNLMTLL